VQKVNFTTRFPKKRIRNMSISVKEAVSKIEVHYFFADSSHSMNALDRAISVK
jgi:hypothetical protein